MIDLSSINGITQDSRTVKPGFLFAALKGELVDGREYIPDAIKAGATHILCDESTRVPDGIKHVSSSNPRKTFAQIVAQFYPSQPERIVSVTGTNGKTSVVNFVEQIWKYLGFKAASIGTLQGGMTTADPVTLHQKLTKLKSENITHLAMEASSHGLDQYRLDGVNIAAAGFTNISRDHLDYHKTMAAYLKAKERLFTDILPNNGRAILNADSPEVAEIGTRIDAKIWTYGRAGEHIHIKNLVPTPMGQDCTVEISGETYDFHVNLVGEFQLYNALCALGLVLSEGDIDIQNAIKAIETLKGVRGRLQLVDAHPEKAAIYVDYAHTPDALENVLKALRPHTENRLICLFGCGGDRDTGKRPEMGKIASQYADLVIVTDDNPRSENPSTIRSAILAAAPNATEIGDRQDAIQKTIKTLTKGDILIIAGKGHEQGQIFADRTDPFDDVEQATKAIQSMIKETV
ncbi:MAG: UDP-N-acetylmuramoyl-L-alanyl-D-glutamate--2,6-diaminopimelate ligase [Bdellovibrionales bacterium]